MAVEDLSYRDYSRIFLRRWPIPTFLALVGAVAGIMTARIQAPQPVYVARASMHYGPAPEDSDALATQLVFMRSAIVLGNVAKRIGMIPADTPREKLQEFAPTSLKLLTRIFVSIDPKQRSGVITVSANAKSPEEAATLANTFVAAAQEENLFLMKRDIVLRRQFIESQIAENEDLLNKAQLDFELYRRQHPEAAVEPGMSSSVARSVARAQELAEKIRETRRQLSLVQSGRAPSDIGLQLIVGATGTARLQQLSAKYTKLNLERATLLTELTEIHPVALAKEQELANVRNEIESELQLILDAFHQREIEENEALEQVREREKTLPEEAMRLANLARNVKVYENIQLQLRHQLEDALIKEAGVTTQISVISAATPIAKPANPPQYLRFGGLGFISGFFVGLVFAVLLETTRFSLRTLREIEESLGVPVIAIAARVRADEIAAWTPDGHKVETDSPEWARSLALATLLAPRSRLGETFRTLRTSLEPRIASGPAVLSVTATNRHEGTTTTAMNLALSFAQSGRRVLLVEADLRNPAISEILGVQSAPGLTDLLLGAATLEQTARSVADFVTGKLSLDEILLGPGIDHFHVMPCGDISAGVGEILGSETFAGVLDLMTSRYDLVILDTPPVTLSADAVTASRGSAVIVVYNPAVTDRSGLESTMTSLQTAQSVVVGLFVNGMDVDATATQEFRAESAQAAL